MCLFIMSIHQPVMIFLENSCFFLGNALLYVDCSVFIVIDRFFHRGGRDQGVDCGHNCMGTSQKL